MILETVTFNTDVSLSLLDQTRHYFGGYYHVKVLVFGDIPVKSCYFGDVNEYHTVVALMGNSVRFERVLEKMAVPEADIESVRSKLMQTFHETSRSYLSVPDFASRFVRNEYRKRIRKSSGISARVG